MYNRKTCALASLLHCLPLSSHLEVIIQTSVVLVIINQIIETIENNTINIKHHPIHSTTMYGLSKLVVLVSIASSALAALNDTGEYRLKSELKPHQRNKRLFENLVSEK
jgi:hypothetical protein